MGTKALLGGLLASALLASGAWLASASWRTQSSAAEPAQATAAKAHAGPELAAPAVREETPRSRRGGMDVTFLVSADTHLGYGKGPPPEGPAPARVEDAVGIEADHVRAIEAMNTLQGRAWPRGLSGTFGQPRGLLVAGDLTEDGRPEEWARFVAFYGHRGGDGLLDYPVFEGIGNHDKHYGFYVKDRVRERHGGQIYSWDWHDLHLVCLGEAPDDEDISWLRKDLAAAGREVGVILYFHFPLKGPYSDNWFGQGNYRDTLMKALDGYRVLGIFHGHYHAAGHYRYGGYDIYNVGSAKHGHKSFAAVQVRDDRMVVASYNYRWKRWWWWHDKPVFDAPGRGRFWAQPNAGLIHPRAAR